MPWLRQFLFRLQPFFRRQKLEAQLSEEVRTHLEMQTEANLAAGMSREEARYAAQRNFGGVDQVKEAWRDERGLPWLENLARDVRFAARMLRKNPGFIATAVLTLALGIGANTAMFSIVNRIVLQPLPYAEPAQLVQLWEDYRGDGISQNSVSGGVARSWQEQSTTLESLAAINLINANLTGRAQPVRLRGLQVSPNYLGLLRLGVVRGRDFHADEGRTASSDVVILSHGAWQKYFAGTEDIVGRTIQLDHRSRTVIGILAPGSRLTVEGDSERLTLDADFLSPFDYDTPGWNRAFAGHNLDVVARLKPTATIEQVRAEMAAITARIRTNFPDFKRNWGVTVVPLHEQVTGRIRPQLLLLFGATACVVLIACTNLAGLLLARAVSRESEMAVRLALGANRWSILRQLLGENLLLALGGGLLGMLLAQWSVHLFENWRPADLASGLPVSIDHRALAFALALSLLTGIAAGLVPAWRLARTPFDALRSSGRTSETAAHARIRGVLVISQLALSLILLLGAGLLLRSLAQLQAVPLGFEPAGVLVADLSLEAGPLNDPAKRVLYLDQIVHRIETLPGVQSAGIASALPLHRGLTELFAGEASTIPRTVAGVCFVTGNHLATLKIPLLKGRAFTVADNRPDAPRTVLISADLAKQHFPNEDPIGRRVRLLGQSWEVVGLTGPVLARGAGQGAFPEIYVPEAFSFGPNRSLIVRTKLPPLSIAQSVQTAILDVAPDQPISGARTFDQVLAQQAFVRRLMLGLLGLFSAIALTLAVIGLYGIIAFSVQSRMRELGIRTALGAPRKHIIALVLCGGLKLTATGILVGLTGGYFLSRLLTAFLFGVTAGDPFTIVGVTLTLVGSAFLACWIPARRASKVDPVIALRAE